MHSRLERLQLKSLISSCQLPDRHLAPFFQSLVSTAGRSGQSDDMHRRRSGRQLANGLDTGHPRDQGRFFAGGCGAWREAVERARGTQIQGQVGDTNACARLLPLISCVHGRESVWRPGRHHDWPELTSTTTVVEWTPQSPFEASAHVNHHANPDREMVRVDQQFCSLA